jgi:hypothetical protein
MTTETGSPGGGARAPAGARGGAWRAAAALGAALLAAGCAPPRAGVDDPGVAPRGSRAGVRFQFDARAPGVAAPRVTFTFHDGRTRRTVSSTGFSTERSGTPYSRYFETAAEGTLEVAAVLQGGAGDTLAAGTVALPLRPGQEWGVLAGVMRRSLVLRRPGIDPARFREAWPLRGEEGASDPVVLYLAYASRSTSRPLPR